jgi:hypothetical protein
MMTSPFLLLVCCLGLFSLGLTSDLNGDESYGLGEVTVKSLSLLSLSLSFLSLFLSLTFFLSSFPSVSLSPHFLLQVLRVKRYSRTEEVLIDLANSLPHLLVMIREKFQDKRIARLVTRIGRKSREGEEKERKRERERGRVCVCEREREREKER